MKVIKKFKTAATFMLLGLAVFFSLTERAKADMEYDLEVFSYYEVDRDVSLFSKKYTTSNIGVMVGECTGTMDFSAVGAYSMSPGDNYADCSLGRSYRITKDLNNHFFEITNVVVEKGYTHAGIMAEAVFDDYAETYGYFRADL